MPLNRTELKYGTMKIKNSYMEKASYMDDWAWYNIYTQAKGFTFNAAWKCTLSLPLAALPVVRLMKECFQTNPLQGTKLKYVAMKLNTFVNFIWKFKSDVIWLRG